MEPPDTFLVRRLSISKAIQVIKVCTNHKVWYIQSIQGGDYASVELLFISFVETLGAQPAKNDVRRGIRGT